MGLLAGKVKGKHPISTGFLGLFAKNTGFCWFLAAFGSLRLALRTLRPRWPTRYHEFKAWSEERISFRFVRGKA